MTDVKPRGYWLNYENILLEAQNIQNRFGYLPSRDILEKKHYNSFCVTLVKYHGGFRKLREDLKLEVYHSADGYWKKWEHVESKLTQIIGQINHFPTQSELNELKEYPLINGMGRYHGGLRKVKEKLGYISNQKERGYWKSWKPVTNGLDLLTHKLGHFPSYTELREHNPALLKGIETQHGGYNVVRTKKGVSLSRKEAGYWNNEKTLFREAQQFMSKHGFDMLPNPDEITKLGANSLRSAIVDYGGFRKLRENLGGVNTTLAAGTWMDVDFTLKKALEIMAQYSFDVLPSHTKLLKLGQGILGYAITRYHGGFPAFREKLNKCLGRESESQQLEDLLNAYVGGKNG